MPSTIGAPGAVLEAELLGQRVAAGGLPDLGRVEDRHLELLGADAVHLLAHDRLGAPDRPQAERQQRVEAGGELAHQAGPHHQDVADGLGVGRRVAQGRPEAAAEADRAAQRGVRKAPALGAATRASGLLTPAGAGQREAGLDVLLDHRDEVVGQGRALERAHLLAVDVDRRARLLAGARQADADVGGAALAGAVDDAAHHGHLQLGDARALGAPLGHAGLEVAPRSSGRAPGRPCWWCARSPGRP